MHVWKEGLVNNDPGWSFILLADEDGVMLLWTADRNYNHNTTPTLTLSLNLIQILTLMQHIAVV